MDEVEENFTRQSLEILQMFVDRLDDLPTLSSEYIENEILSRMRIFHERFERGMSALANSDNIYENDMMIEAFFIYMDVYWRVENCKELN